MINNIKAIILLLFVATTISAQSHFEGTFTNTNNKLTFKVKPVGGSITESLTYIDFNIRYAPTLNVSFNNIEPNSTDFPGINMQQAPERQFNGKKYKRFVHNTGTLGMKTYVENTEYIVFSVTLADMSHPIGDFELVMDVNSENNFPNDFFFSVNNSIGLPITDQTAPFSYFYPAQTNPSGSEYVQALPNVPLPVELLSFEAQPLEKSIALNWVVADEVNLSNYEVLRSLDAKEFVNIGFVNYNQFKTGNYGFVDSEVKTNTNYYYKLLMRDLDGRFEYSDIRLARIGSDLHSSFDIYPNPGKDQVFVNSLYTNVSKMTISDIQGKDVTSQVAVSKVNDNGFYIDCTTLITGTYFLKINEDLKKLVIVK